ncbi:TatD family hydrolase [Ponticaulis profundi]|uniref:TatD family hydrolase n=1 Tax=Ponticaulis profundi TaxID=2665222 RepID=A0ABW1SFK0_9PROT
MLFDTHVNLHGEPYEQDLQDVLARAREASVTRMLAICDKIENVDRIAEIVRAENNMWRSVGSHPHYAKDHGFVTAELLLELSEPEDVVGIGETGLDFHYGYSPADDQKRVFQAHIEACQRSGLPLIVHTRDADQETGDMLEAAYAEQPFPILMHCYTSGEELARRAIDLDAYFSVSGIATFKNAHDVRDVLKLFPKDRVILETDCPYLAPVPMRGRRNEPAFLVHVCQYLADMEETSYEVIANRTTENAMRLFQRIERASV